MSGGRLIRVHVVQEHPVIREAIADALGREPDIAVVGLSADSCRSTATRPDVIALCVGQEKSLAELVADAAARLPR